MSLELREASFRYPKGPWVFQGLDLTVTSGEVLCLLGPNGCGKTTLLKCLCRLLDLTEGRSRIGSHGGPLDARALARQVGFIPQSHDLAFPFTTFELVLMGRTPHLPPLGSPTARDETLALEALTRVGLDTKAHHLYSVLSGGERHLALLARALCQAPSCLLLDEPVAHLDLRNRDRVLAILSSLAEEGYALAFTAHDPAVAHRIAHRVALMHAGGALTLGSTDEVLTEAHLGRAYGLDLEVLRASTVRGRRVLLVST